jgi:AbiV family abortive infection protein
MNRLTPDQMGELSLAALANARRPFDDALTLRESERFATAYLLVGLAADELGKHVLVASFYGAREESDAEWNKFWRRFRNHQEKLGDALWGAWAGDLMTDEPPPDIPAFHQRRLAATYVDLDPSGALSVPEAVVTTSELDDALNRVGGELEFCETALKDATPTRLGTAFADMRASDTAEQMRDMLKSGPMSALALAISLRSGLSKDDALKFATRASEIFEGLPDERGSSS